MADFPLISIPVFTYNGADFLAAQLDSLYAQTYPNIEILVCDDGSTDETVRILKCYEASHGLNFEQNSENIGLNKNVEKALGLCAGEYIAPCDQDDIWYPDKIQILFDAIENNQLIYSKNIRIGVNDQVIEEDFKKTDYLISGNNALAFLFGNCASGHTMLFRQSLISELSPMPPDILLFDKWIVFVAALVGAVAYVDKPLVKYRQHENQTTFAKKIKTINPIKRFIIKDAEKKKGFNNLLEIITLFHDKMPVEHEEKWIVTLIKDEYKKLQYCYFSPILYGIYVKYSDKLFAMSNEAKHAKISKRMARGVWYYRLRLYL